jgi:arabinofuranosyltransferase
MSSNLKTYSEKRSELISYVGSAVLLVSALSYLGNVYRYHLERWDDAFITFRFAQHLADGCGLIWNIGGERVEGFTSMLHVLLLAAGIKLGIDPWFGSLLISVASVLATAAMMVLILRRQTGAIHPVAAILVGIYLLDVNTAVHTTSGLETPLFVALLCACYFLALNFIETARWQTAIGLSIAVFLSCLCRPEAVIYGFAVYFALMIYCVSRKPESEGNFAKLTVSSGLLIAFGAVYALWKYNYFGYLLPNPFYVKSSKFALAGLPEVTDYLKHLGKWFAPFLAAGWLLFFTSRSDKQTILEKVKANAAKILLTLLPPFFALAYYSTIIHEVGGGHRFSYPTYFYFVLAGAMLLSFVFDSVKPNHFSQLVLTTIGLIVFGAMFVSQKSWQIAPVAPSAFNQYHTKIADALKATELGSRATILCDAAGIIPYVSGFNQVDRVGLVDNFLSGRKPVTDAEREAYIWSREPDVYVGYEPPANVGAQRPEDDTRMKTPYVSQILLQKKLTLVESRVFVQDPQMLHSRMRELRDNWHLIGEIKWAGWDAWRLKSFVYVRRSSLFAPQLISALENIVQFEPNQINLDDIDTQ